MAATPLPVNTLTHTGAAPVTEVAADPTNGNVLSTNNGTTTWVEATNTVASSATIILTTPGTVDGNPVDDKTYNLPGTVGAKLRFVVGSVAVYGANPLITASATTVTLAAYQV